MDKFILYYGDLYVEFCGVIVGVRDDVKDNWWKLCWLSLHQFFLKV